MLQVENLGISFRTDEGLVRAVDGVSFQVQRGRTLGIVGESGSGKSVSMRALMRLLPPNARIDATSAIHWQSNGDPPLDVAALPRNSRRLRQLRGGEMGMIFQEPMASFSPVYTIGNQIIEAVRIHRDVSKSEARTIALEMLQRVGIANPERRIDQYPFEFSGGMRQRAMIALALSCRPALLIADEPTTALDVTIQAQILRLMRDLQQELAMAIIFITHDLGVIAQIADEIAVMYLGRIVEYGTTRAIFHNPQHPYTMNLLRAVPRVGQARARLATIDGNVPSPLARPQGCVFHTRCAQRIAGRCEVEAPPLVQIAANQSVHCLLYE
ncbi:MAG: ABC transporter ATP-binding protein [Oscillochloris sp.]|nr:ABC transporter ATP-binding protein [Oscillochloris sp.]